MMITSDSARLRARSWRAVIAAFLAIVVVLASAAPIWAAASAALKDPSSTMTSGSPSKDTHDDADRDCLTFHGSHCHHQADRQEPSSVEAPVATDAALYTRSERRLASLLTTPPPKPPRD